MTTLDQYNVDSMNALNQADPALFQPSLTTLDAVIASFAFAE